MCGIAVRRKKTFFPGVTTSIITPDGVIRRKWGDKSGQYYNARGEKLYSTWKNWLKCILEVDFFLEEGIPYSRNINETMLLGGLFDDKEFMVITQPANDLIAEVHHRMPLIVNEKLDHFLYDENITLDDFSFNNDKIIQYRRENVLSTLEHQYY